MLLETFQNRLEFCQLFLYTKAKNVDVKSTCNIDNGLHPLISLDVKSIRNIKNMLKKSVCSENVLADLF